METLKQRIKRLCKENGTSMAKLERDLGMSRGYLCKIDDVRPTSDRIDKIAKYFNVTQEFLLYGEDSKDNDNKEYYLDKDARDLAEFMYKNPEYKVLFDASKHVRKEDILLVKELMDKMRQPGPDDTGC